MIAPQTEYRLPFGKHAGKPLADVPADYLNWLLRSCKLSSGLRLVIGDGLRKRNIDVPPTPPPQIPNCPRCGNTLHDFIWQQDATGGRRIRVECRYCRRFILWAPLLPEFIAEADRHAKFYQPAGPLLHHPEKA
jgi:hypothetical protein